MIKDRESTQWGGKEKEVQQCNYPEKKGERELEAANCFNSSFYFWDSWNHTKLLETHCLLVHGYAWGMVYKKFVQYSFFFSCKPWIIIIMIWVIQRLNYCKQVGIRWFNLSFIFHLSSSLCNLIASHCHLHAIRRVFMMCWCKNIRMSLLKQPKISWKLVD